MRTSCSVIYRDDVLGYVFLGGHTEEDGAGRYRLYPADGLRQRFHFRADCGLSVVAEGLRIECLDWDTEGGTVRIYLEKIPEENVRQVTLTVRDCTAEIFRAGKGISQSGWRHGVSTVDFADTGADADDGGENIHWVNIRIGAEE